MGGWYMVVHVCNSSHLDIETGESPFDAALRKSEKPYLKKQTKSKRVERMAQVLPKIEKKCVRYFIYIKYTYFIYI
jgi:hypothetical protein